MNEITASEFNYSIQKGIALKNLSKKKEENGRTVITFTEISVIGVGSTNNLNSDYDYVFSRCNFEQGLEIQSSTFQNIKFEYCSGLELLIRDIEGSYLILRYCTFKEISISAKTKYLSLDRCESEVLRIFSGTYDYFSILGGVYDSISFEGGSFKSLVRIGVRVKCNVLRFEKSIFKGDCSISDTKRINSLEINGAKFNKTLAIRSTTLGNIIAFKSGKIKCLKIENITSPKIHFRDTIIQECYIHKGCNITEEIGFRKYPEEAFIEHSQVKKILFVKKNKNHINLTDLKINTIEMDSLNNQGKLRLISLAPLETDGTIYLNVKNSTLGDTEIVGCNWSNGKLTVDNSRIIDLYYTNTLFPKTIASEESVEVKKNEQIRDTYSQLKTVADKQNDRQSSLYFQAKSNEYIYKLKSEGMVFWNLCNPNWSEWFQLWLSKWSNNFGTSYTLAIKRIIIFSPILFILYVVNASDNIVWTTDARNWGSGIGAVWEYSGDFWGFLNPARKYGYLCPDGGCTSGWAKFIDWFSRAFIAYLLYQAVQAFRKYGKS